MLTIQAEGLREIAQSLREINYSVFTEMVAGLKEVGDVVRSRARSRFIAYGFEKEIDKGRATGFVKAADGFQTLVRPNTSTMALVSVGQTLRSTRVQPRRRPNFGDLMMRKALLPARNETLEDAAAVLEARVLRLVNDL